MFLRYLYLICVTHYTGSKNSWNYVGKTMHHYNYETLLRHLKESDIGVRCCDRHVFWTFHLILGLNVGWTIYKTKLQHDPDICPPNKTFFSIRQLFNTFPTPLAQWQNLLQTATQYVPNNIVLAPPVTVGQVANKRFVPIIISVSIPI